jgi:hypothetical protein
MKTWLTLLVLGGLVTVGLSSRVAAQPDMGPSDAEFEAHVDARLSELMHTLLTAPPQDARTAALGR